MESVGATLGDHADLAAGSGPEFRRVVVRIHAELLHVFHARLQAEWAGDFAVKVAGVIAYDAAGFDTVVADGVFLVGTAVEAHVVEGPRSEIDGARCHQVELRNLAAVDGELCDFPFADVATDCRGTDINDGKVAARNLDFGGNRGRLHCDVQSSLLPYL